MASDAVGLERISRIVGYKITKGNFQTTSPNLPQRIAVLAEANTANQGTLSLTPLEITSAQQVGDAYGYGSPAHIIARILFPQNGGGIGGVPVVFYPQAEAGGATSKKIEIIPSGYANNNGTHTVVVSGRAGLEGEYYDINIVTGDSTAEISAKISDAVNAILGAPCIATDTDYHCDLETKWKGLTAQEFNVSIDTNSDSLGITYGISTLQNAIGTPSITAALNTFGNDWNTIVINSYGAVSSIMNTLESFNGIPDPSTPTGRFVGIVMKPFIALTGSTLDNPTSITDARLDNVTIAICPAPGSDGFAMEAAANMAVLFANVSQNTPQLDVASKKYPDMPTPTSIGSMADYNNRDSFVKKGSSTVDLIAGYYVVQDFVTTYHPLGENPPQFRYCRNLMLDFNVRFGYYLLEQINVVDHAIAADSDTVSASNVVKPKQWKAILKGYASDLTNRGLVVDTAFMTDSINVNLSTSNPDRLETFFKYKRSGFVRIASTTAEAGFNFGTLS